jgi:hypothetical protein
MKPKVYIETTIPSFYHEVRTEPDMIARRQWTQEWWDRAGEYCDRVTSLAVLDELADGDYPNKRQILSLVENLPLLSLVSEIGPIVRSYIEHHVMPNDPGGDALHLALASYHECDFLLTWNCRHLANANKFGHIRTVNEMLGLYVPVIATPLELIEGNDDER